jgi:hypothetical protein
LAAAPEVPARWWISADLLSTLLTGLAAAFGAALLAGFFAGLRADFLAFAMGER